MFRCRSSKEVGLEAAAGAAMIMDNKRPVRVSNFEAGETAAVPGRYRFFVAPSSIAPLHG